MLILALVLFPQTLTTMRTLAQAGRVLISPDTLGPLIQQIRTPGAGETVLPAPVQAMLFLVRSHRLPSFRYSAAIDGNTEIRQRLIEGAHPVRPSPDSPYLFLIAGEQLSAACSLLARREGIILVHCP